MSGRRTTGMTAIGALHLAGGIVGAAASVMMILESRGIVGAGGVAEGASPALLAAFGIARFVISTLLVVAGIGVFGLDPRARRLSLQYAMYWVVINFIEPPALGYDYRWSTWLAMVYPMIVVWAFTRPRWKDAFANVSPSTS